MIELEGASRARAVQDCGRSAPSTGAILLSQVFQGDGDGDDNHRGYEQAAPHDGDDNHTQSLNKLLPSF